MSMSASVQIARTTLSKMRGLPENVANGVAGLVAGLAYLAAQMMFSSLLGLNGASASLQRIGGLLLGPDSVSPGRASTIEMAMGALIHLPLSMIYGALIGRLVRNRSPEASACLGAGIGLLLFVLNFFLIAPSAFPWFLEVRNVPTAFDHAVFGAIAGWLSV